MKRNAFTLVELLVVIAIIGILVGLLLPAVQAAREAARRMSCSNNLLQVALATHHFEFNMEHLPAGVSQQEGPIRNEPNAGEHIGWMVRILPYIEQQAAYGKFDFSKSVYAEENAEVRAMNVGTYKCPSSPHRYGFQQSPNVATSDFAACYHDVEAPIDNDNHGVMFLNSDVRFADITDGATNTILLGEHVGNDNVLGWVSGSRATLRNTGEFVDVRVGGRDRSERDLGALEVGGFDSFHAGGGNFAMADGAVIFLTHSIDPELYLRLGHRADGELVDFTK